MATLSARLSLLLFACVLGGCTSTKLVDATWDDSVVQQINAWSDQRALITSKDGIFENRGVKATIESILVPTDVALGQLTTTPENYFEGEIYYWRLLHPDAVQEVSFSRINRGRGFLFGAMPGVVLGALITTGMNKALCDASNCSGAPAGTYAFVASAGGLLTGLVGMAIGTKQTTIFRFRPDTPQEMSVVIGVAQTAPARTRME